LRIEIRPRCVPVDRLRYNVAAGDVILTFLDGRDFLVCEGLVIFRCAEESLEHRVFGLDATFLEASDPVRGVELEGLRPCFGPERLVRQTASHTAEREELGEGLD